MLDTIYMQVLDMSTTASIVILVVLLARFALKKAPKVFSYALWAVVLFRLLCPFSLETPVSVVPELPSVSQGYTLSEEPISVWGASVAAYQAVGDALNGGLGVQHVGTTERDETGMTRYVTTDWWSVWILFGQYVWAAGIAGMLLYSAVSSLKIKKKLLVVVSLRDNIFVADEIKSPFVVGLFRPKIYLPCNLEEREQEYIILHEQHHIKRLDHIAKLLAFLALTIHWFNPLVWLAFVLASKDMEMSCDEAVIRKAGSDVRAEYSASLLTLATGRRIIAGTPLAFGEGDTKGRIVNLAKWKKPVVWVVIASIITCTAVAICLLTNPIKQADALIPGTTYVPYQRLYMNPLSSFAAIGGDSGCTYVVGEDYFDTIYCSNRVSINATDPGADIAQHRIDVSKWRWQEFPYTDEEWAALYWPKGIGSIERISKQYSEMLYQPLSANRFLLKMDGSLWLVDISNDPKVGTYIWSIYSLVPESAMGEAQWEYAPMLSSRIAMFPFNFDLEHTEISAYCTRGRLGVYGVDPDSSVSVKNGETLYWSPEDENGNVAETAVIRFSVFQEDTPTYNGTIYIESTVDSNGRMFYTATIVGTGLYLAPNAEAYGGIVSAQ